MSSFEIRDVPRQDTVTVTVSTSPGRIGDVMGEALGKAFAAAELGGAAPVGAPYARYIHLGPDRIEFEAGVPVDHPIAERDGTRPGVLGGCRAAVAMHVGPYETLAETYEALEAWMTDQGVRPAGAMWEHYLSDPDREPDPARWRTEIYIPLR